MNAITQQIGTQLAAADRPPVKLVGGDGNALAILGACRAAAKKAGWPEHRWIAVRDEMTAGDYSALLATAMKHFDVR